MVITNYPNVSINTANPPTEQARRDALRRDLFTPVKESEKSAAEKPLLSDEKARAAGNSNNQVTLYNANGKETETQQAVEGRNDQQRDERESQGNDQQAASDDKQQTQAEPAEQQKIQELKARDAEVKTHEQAHAAAGGQYAGAPSYSYEQGPDGKRYAVDGEVPIDVSKVADDPQATIQKLQQVQAAAMAPAQPSGADLRIAAEAAQGIVQAQHELTQQKTAAASPDAKSQVDEGDKPAVKGATVSRFTDLSAETDISYSVTDAQGHTEIGTLQSEHQATTNQMHIRRSVIAGFYQQATAPKTRLSIDQA